MTVFEKQSFLNNKKKLGVSVSSITKIHLKKYKMGNGKHDC